jgi:adenosine deaminase
VRYRPAGTVGLGLGGPEVGVGRADFAPAFRAARDAGLHSDPHAAADLAGLARAGARAAFCPEPTRRAILAEIDRLPIPADQPGK